MRVFLVSVLFLLPLSTIPAQDQRTSVTLGNQDIEFVDAEWRFFNDDDNRRLVLIPKTGQQTAKARITEGTQTSYYSGGEIHYSFTNEAFLLDGNARIERDDIIMDGPEKIEYTPVDESLVILGTRENPATLEYILPEGVPFVSKAVRFDLTFADVDGKRTLVFGQSSGILMGRTESRDYRPERPLMRKLSSPRR